MFDLKRNGVNKMLKWHKRQNDDFIITNAFKYEVGVMLVRFLVDGIENFGIRIIDHNGFSDVGYSSDYLFIRGTYRELVSYHWAKIQQANFENKLLARI